MSGVVERLFVSKIRFSNGGGEVEFWWHVKVSSSVRNERCISIGEGEPEQCSR